MVRRQKWLWLLVAVVVTVASPAFASVEGAWDVEGPIVTGIKVKGQPAGRNKGTIGDQVVFNQDGTFANSFAGGTWTEARNKFIVALDPAQIEGTFEEILAAQNQGLNIQVTVKRSILKGKENRAGDQIKGKWTLTLGLYVVDYALPGKATLRFSFTGGRTPVEKAGKTAGDAGDPKAALRALLGEAVRRILSTR